jgi:hypothetical protein
MLFQRQRLYIVGCGVKIVSGANNDFEGNGYGLFQGSVLEFASRDCAKRENPRSG